MAGAEGVDVHGRSNTTMSQSSSGAITGPETGASHTAGGNKKAESSGYQQFDEGAEDDALAPDYSDMGDSATDDEGEDDDSPGGSNALLAFPDEIGLSKSMRNYMLFTIYKVVGGFGSKRKDADYQQVLAPICLPIPTGITTSYGHDWSQNDVSAAQSFIGETFNNQLRQAGTAALGVINETARVESRTDSEGNVISAIKGGASGAIRGIGDLIAGEHKAALAASGVGVLSNNPLVGRPLAQASGLATFTETAITYGGPAYREFGYTFRLIPGSDSENTTIKMIVDRFKFAAAPEQHSDQLYRIYSLPYVFQISFWHKTSEHTHIPKIGKCALTSFGVTHGGDRFSTHTDGHPVQTDISLQFREIELLSRDKVEEGY